MRQQLVGRQAPICNSLGAASSGLAGASGHGVLDHFSDDDDYPMNDIDAGPSGVRNDTPMQYPPPPIPNSLPIPNSPSHNMPETNDNIVLTLSSTRRSQRALWDP